MAPNVMARGSLLDGDESSPDVDGLLLGAGESKGGRSAQIFQVIGTCSGFFPDGAFPGGAAAEMLRNTNNESNQCKNNIATNNIRQKSYLYW